MRLERIILLLALALSPLTPYAATRTDMDPSARHGLVNCYDPGREMVSRTRPGSCQGRVVSDSEAKAIQQKRREHVKEALVVNASPSALGKRLIGIGAGFFVDRRGSYLLTNSHVVKGCNTLTLTRPDGGTHPAKLKTMDLSLDLALLETRFRSKEHAIFAPPNRATSGDVAVIGYPNQGLPPLVPILTLGSLSPSNATPSERRPLTLKAAVRPGNSGGPVLDQSGHVVGVVFAAVDTRRTYQHTGRIVRDIGIAIPNNISLGFLKHHGVKPEISEDETRSRNVLDDAKGYVARVECWR